jgi:zinc protease
MRADDGTLSGRLTDMLFLGRSFATVAEFEANVAALTPGQLQAVVAKYLDPATMAIVKAGDFAKKGTAQPSKP